MTKSNNIDFKNDASILSRFRQVVDSFGKRSDAANMADVTEDAIRKYMNGKAVPSIEVVSKLCLNAQISIDWLITGKAQYSNASSLPTISGYVLSPNKKLKTGDLGYFELTNNETIIAIIKSESKDSFEVTILNQNQVRRIEKSDISFSASAQIIKSAD